MSPFRGWRHVAMGEVVIPFVALACTPQSALRDEAQDAPSAGSASSPVASRGDQLLPPPAKSTAYSEGGGCGQTFLDVSTPDMEGYIAKTRAGIRLPLAIQWSYEEWRSGSLYVRFSLRNDTSVIEAHGLHSWTRAMPETAENSLFWKKMGERDGFWSRSLSPRNAHLIGIEKELMNRAIGRPSCRVLGDERMVALTVIVDHGVLQTSRREWTYPSCDEFPSKLNEMVWSLMGRLLGAESTKPQ